MLAPEMTMTSCRAPSTRGSVRSYNVDEDDHSDAVASILGVSVSLSDRRSSGMERGNEKSALLNRLQRGRIETADRSLRRQRLQIMVGVAMLMMFLTVMAVLKLINRL